MNIEKIIKSKIFEKKRDMRLDYFLSSALYEDKGYYSNQNPIEKKNDFVTAPEISQMFGEIIGLYLYYIWKENINSKFNLIELGPGNGTLLKDISRRRGIPINDSTVVAHHEIQKLNHYDPIRFPMERPNKATDFDWKSLDGITYDHAVENYGDHFPHKVTG